MSNLKSCVGILFIISLIVGAYLGYLIIEGIQSDRQQTPEMSFNLDPAMPATSSPGNNNILVLGVDDLTQPNPALEGAWLVTLNDQSQSENLIHFSLITLYPVTPDSMLFSIHGHFAQPHAPIRIDPDNLAGVAQIDPISFSRGQWSTVVVMDEILINAAITLQIPNHPQPIPTPGKNTFFKPWLDPARAFQQQTGILTTLCDNPEPFSQPNMVRELLAMEGIHIRTNMSEGGLLLLWQALDYTQQKQVSCQLYPEWN